MYFLHKIEPIFPVTHLVNVSYYRLPSDYAAPGEVHDFWEFVYVDKGEVVVQAGETEYLLKSGEMAFHCPNEFHNVMIYQEKPANILVMAFCCTSENMKELEHRILPLGQQEKQCLSTIVREADGAYLFFENQAPSVRLQKKETAAFGAEQIIRACLEQLLIYISRREKHIMIESRGIPDHLFHYSRLVEQAKSYMEEHIQEKICLSDLAAVLNISVSQLKRIFKERTSTSVIAYLTELRIAKAKHLIRQHELNFTQIAEAVGYDNIYYFSAQFKRQTGMTPTEYSRSVRE